jgi:hypothetical protein
MQKMYPEHVSEAAQRVEEIKTAIADIDVRIAGLDGNGYSPLKLAELRRQAKTEKDNHLEALAIAEDDLKNITAQFKAFEKKQKDGNVSMAKLEAKQAENIPAYFQALAVAWEKAVEAAKVQHEADILQDDFALGLLRSRTYHGTDYAQEIDKILSFLEFNQPDDFNAAGIKTRHERGEIEEKIGVRVIS